MLEAVADDKESTWHLGEETDSWSTQTAKSLRAMLRHVAQAVTKACARRDPLTCLRLFVHSSQARHLPPTFDREERHMGGSIRRERERERDEITNERDT
eukprot:1015364-Pyramimonas_sp.AAC.1